MTLLLVLMGAVFVGLNTGVAYVAIGTKVVPIITGVILCLVFVIAVRLLHRAAWLAFLAFAPALFVLVGSVQFAPEAALERRGVRQEVAIVDVEVTGKRHAFTLQGADGRLDEPLVYQGSNPSYQVGDRLAVLTDPDGKVEVEAADRVDSSGMLGMLILGWVGWTFIALLAGWRGHVRRRKGRFDDW
ncbi:hypothetical protein [Micromonospora peucetia]|uniref:Uncharacterized protein n=1 Tax=Micromonospora peucetia TaxID=47871 RepID=A0A1C6VHX6_9ACTN|nr:hypothetical protein [Micromonospora peucetia]WSA30350.1 hypothetical protein OIE14_19310 [Micromonospora peucetia]SCL65892.1 hypothetical protein GA0070608_3186 [Micromonospora peucetia]